eukprot:6316249-Karenia_brevis.AAC.1
MSDTLRQKTIQRNVGNTLLVGGKIHVADTMVEAVGSCKWCQSRSGNVVDDDRFDPVLQCFCATSFKIHM